MIILNRNVYKLAYLEEKEREKERDVKVEQVYWKWEC